MMAGTTGPAAWLRRSANHGRTECSSSAATAGVCRQRLSNSPGARPKPGTVCRLSPARPPGALRMPGHIDLAVRYAFLPSRGMLAGFPLIAPRHGGADRAGEFRSARCVPHASGSHGRTTVAIATSTCFVSSLKDAEPGSAGYLLTGRRQLLCSPHNLSLGAMELTQHGAPQGTADDSACSCRPGAADRRPAPENCAGWPKPLNCAETGTAMAAVAVTRGDAGRMLMDASATWRPTCPRC